MIRRRTPQQGRVVKRRRTANTYGRQQRAQRGRMRTTGYYGRYNNMPGREWKFFDGSKAATNLSATGAILDDSINEVAQGTAENERIGRKMTIKSIHFKGAIKIPGQTAIADASQRIRIIVYLDKQANGATAGVTDILESQAVDSFRNLENSKRFGFLYDKTVSLNQLCGGGNGSSDRLGEVIRNFQINKRCNIPIQFNSTTGAITEMCCNNVGIMAICDSITSTAPQINYNWRIRFVG